MPMTGVITMNDAMATCNDCGFQWFGATAAHALRTIGACTRCRGELTFNTNGSVPPALEPLPTDRTDVPAHLVLGTPRL